MKTKITILFFILICNFNFAFANSQFEYLVGGVTPHLKSPPNNNLCNVIVPNSNIIFSKLHSFRMDADDFGGGALVGENSYCEPIWGATSFYKLYQSEKIETRATIGFYHFDAKGFDFSSGSYFAHLGNFYFVPVAGLEINFRLYHAKNFDLKMVNLITPVVSNHSIGFYFDI